MWALGELLYYSIYVILCLGIIIFFMGAVFGKSKKMGYAVLVLISASLLFIFYNYNQRNYKQSQLQYVGTYDLTNYPSCDSCILLFKDDNTYDVLNKSKIIESGDWHYDFGSDYFIVYINGENERLGDGRFQYQNSRNNMNNK